MDEETQKHIEGLTSYANSIDLRLLAVEEAICEMFGFDETKKEIFRKKIADNAKLFLQIRMEEVEDVDPALAARLLGAQNPYSKDEDNPEDEGKDEEEK